jgi:hypothetical protein
MDFNPAAFALDYHPRDAAREGAAVRETLMTPQRTYDEHKRRDEDTAYRNREQSRAEKRDANTDERDRVAQQQRAVELHGSSRRADQREQLYALQENRRENEAKLNREHTANQEHERLIADLHSAAQSRNPDAIQAAIEALQRAGYGAEEMQHNPPPPAMPDAAQVPPDTSTAPPGVPPAPNLPGMAYKPAMAAADAQGALGVNQVGPDRWAPISAAESDAANADNNAMAPKGKAGRAPPLLGKVPSWLQKAMADETASDQSLADPSRLAPDDPYQSLR